MLGPLEVWAAGRRLPAIARKPAALLIAGLLDAGTVVSPERLIDAVWGQDPPRTAAKLVQSYVARLRQILHRPGTAEVITTRPGGYLFQPGDGKLDLHRFQALTALGRAQAAEGRYQAAGDTLDQALGLWRGPALGAPVTVALRVEAARLEEMRLAAVEAMFGARLESGGTDGLVGELTRLVAEHPLREQLRVLEMTALWRCGRRADALKAYQDGDRLLRAELGIGAGPELRALRARLLASDHPRPGSGAVDRCGHRCAEHAPPFPATDVGTTLGHLLHQAASLEMVLRFAGEMLAGTTAERDVLPAMSADRLMTGVEQTAARHTAPRRIVADAPFAMAELEALSAGLQTLVNRTVEWTCAVLPRTHHEPPRATTERPVPRDAAGAARL
ncbi:BTAD domain-containing putative transcriptional regulator [Streptomyces sp. NPDC091280]|uniref:AfsR/SARP family transcriptional regulator n=1 Tax=Streptomyces sp. NPDC091280 TaxID=3365984 RepID=UPI003830A198